MENNTEMIIIGANDDCWSSRLIHVRATQNGIRMNERPKEWMNECTASHFLTPTSFNKMAKLPWSVNNLIKTSLTKNGS